MLTSKSQFQEIPIPSPRDPNQQQEKRIDSKSTPCKSKRSHDLTADSEAEEGSQKSAPMNEDRHTMWDDYSNPFWKSTSRDSPTLAQQALPQQLQQHSATTSGEYQSQQSSQTHTLSLLQELQIAQQTEWRNFSHKQLTVQELNGLIGIQLSQSKTNTQILIGEMRSGKKATMLLGFMYFNVNGFTLDRHGGQFDDYCSMLREVQADVACDQEHNLDTIESQVRSILYDTTQQHWQRSRITFANTPVPFENLYKP